MKLGLIEKLKLALAWGVIKKKWEALKKMAEQESKPWWLSKAVWGTIIGFIVLVASRYGIEGLEAEKEGLADLVVTLAGAVASAIAIYGRVKAQQKLTK